MPNWWRSQSRWSLVVSIISTVHPSKSYDTPYINSFIDSCIHTVHTYTVRWKSIYQTKVCFLEKNPCLCLMVFCSYARHPRCQVDPSRTGRYEKRSPEQHGWDRTETNHDQEKILSIGFSTGRHGWPKGHNRSTENTWTTAPSINWQAS